MKKSYFRNQQDVDNHLRKYSSRVRSVLKRVSSRGNSESSRESYSGAVLIQRPIPKSYGSVKRRRRTKANINPKDS